MSTAGFSSWVCGDRVIDLAAAPRLMGIVNTTPDSFHATTRQPDADAAFAHAVRLVEDLRRMDNDMDNDVRALLRQLEA